MISYSIKFFTLLSAWVVEAVYGNLRLFTLLEVAQYLKLVAVCSVRSSP